MRPLKFVHYSKQSHFRDGHRAELAIAEITFRSFVLSVRPCPQAYNSIDYWWNSTQRKPCSENINDISVRTIVIFRILRYFLYGTIWIRYISNGDFKWQMRGDLNNRCENVHLPRYYWWTTQINEIIILRIMWIV